MESVFGGGFLTKSWQVVNQSARLEPLQNSISGNVLIIIILFKINDPLKLQQSAIMYFGLEWSHSSFIVKFK